MNWTLKLPLFALALFAHTLRLRADDSKQLVATAAHFCFQDAEGVHCWSYGTSGLSAKDMPAAAPELTGLGVVNFKGQERVCLSQANRGGQCWDFASEGLDTVSSGSGYIYPSQIPASNLSFEGSLYNEVKIQGGRLVATRIRSKYGNALSSDYSNRSIHELPLPFFREQALSSNTIIRFASGEKDADSVFCVADSNAVRAFVACRTADGSTVERVFPKATLNEFVFNADAVCFLLNNAKPACVGLSGVGKNEDLIVPAVLSVEGSAALAAAAAATLPLLKDFYPVVPARDKIFLARVLKHFGGNEAGQLARSAEAETDRRVLAALSLEPYLVTLDADNAKTLLHAYLARVGDLSRRTEARSLGDVLRVTQNRPGLHRAAAELMGLLTQTLRSEVSQTVDLGSMDEFLASLPRVLDAGVDASFKDPVTKMRTIFESLEHNADNHGLAQVGIDLANLLLAALSG